MQGKLNELAKELGFEVVEYLFDWNGLEVYEPVMAEETGGRICIGHPMFIVKNTEKVRYGTIQENKEIYDYLLKNFDEE